MSRYVDKKHGLIIGSDNIFFFRDENGELRDNFRAIVWAQGLIFEQHSTAHTGIRSIAEQFIWDEWEETITETIEMDGKTYDCPRHIVRNTPRSYIKWWLNENAPGWGVRPPVGPSSDPTPTIFFAKRSHALTFTRMVEESLKGMEYV